MQELKGSRLAALFLFSGVLSGTISFNFVPDSCVVGTEWYLNVPGRGLGYLLGHKIIPICAGGLEVGNIS